MNLSNGWNVAILEVILYFTYLRFLDERSVGTLMYPLGSDYRLQKA